MKGYGVDSDMIRLGYETNRLADLYADLSNIPNIKRILMRQSRHHCQRHSVCGGMLVMMKCDEKMAYGIRGMLSTWVICHCYDVRGSPNPAQHSTARQGYIADDEQNAESGCRQGYVHGQAGPAILIYLLILKVVVKTCEF